MRTPAPLSYGDGLEAPGCPCGPDSACCSSHEYGAAATAAREAEASVASVEFAVRHRPAALDEVCSGRCNGTPTETCCGVARCADCHREHRYDDCDQLADEVRRDLYPEGCDCTGNATVCPVHRADKRALYGVEAEVRRRAEAGR